ncbi:hypothetical protein MASR2M47_37350 [Draconibacterium sp.]
MDKNTATNLIESTFNQAFDETRFELFAKNFLNDIEPKSNHYSGQYIWDDYKEHIYTYKRIGKYVDPEGEALDILIVEVKSVLKLERARTALRNFVIKHLVKFEKDYALVAFYSKQDEGADWRFSFIKLEHQAYVDEEKGKVKTRKEFTPAKRYSFLVGKYEKAYTAKNQLLPLLQNVSSNATIEEIESAFSIEKVTDEFFSQYKDLFVKLYEHFENDSAIQNELVKSKIDTSRFTKKLLGQIVFLYFLQKKGWLGVPKDKTWGNGEKHFIQKLFDTSKTENKNFFKDYLQYLFYEALAKERDNVNSYYAKFDCRIPFLNGGLFEAEYDWKNANISIPETIFRNTEKNKSGDTGTGILDVFDRYNFTIKEDEPLDKEVAVDPEMLGKVFENMLEITERKSKGAFYTPREIVHYMCQESLIHYLDNCLNQGAQDERINRIEKADIDFFIRKGNFLIENEINAIKKQEKIERGEIKTSKTDFELPASIRQHADLIDKKLTDIKICDPAIGSGAFPVGLLHELVNAHLVIKPHLSPKYLAEKLKAIKGEHNGDELSESRYIYRLKRHIIQESIYGVDIDASAIDIARLRLWLSLVVDEDDFEPIETLPNLDYKIVCGNSLIGMPADVFPDLEKQKEIEDLKPLFYNETNETKKKELRQQINTKIRELLDSIEQFAGYKIDFDFKLFFSEVWHEKGGFDVVIGNPPYGEIIKNHKNFYKKNFISAEGKFEIYKFFIEKGTKLINNEGSLTYITPDTWINLGYFKKLREILLKKHFIYLITETLYNVFSSATVDNNIFLISNSKKYSKTLLVSGDLKKSQLINLNFLDKDFSIILKPTNKLISKISSQPNTLDDLCEVWQGLIAYGSKNQERIWSSETKETEYHKKLLYGGEIDMFHIEWKGEYLKYGEWLHRPRPSYIYEKPHILVQRIRNPKLKQRIKGAIDRDFHVNGTGTSNILLKNSSKLTLEEILCYLNSEVINYWFSYFFFDVNIKPEQLRQIPLPNKSENSLNIIEKYLEFTKPKHQLLYQFYWSLCNSVIFEIFFPTELQTANKEILKHLGDFRPIIDSMSDEEKLAVIQSEFERLYDPNHPVRNNLETLDSIEEVRIIKEALK